MGSPTNRFHPQQPQPSQNFASFPPQMPQGQMTNSAPGMMVNGPAGSPNTSTQFIMTSSGPMIVTPDMMQPMNQFTQGIQIINQQQQHQQQGGPNQAQTQTQMQMQQLGPQSQTQMSPTLAQPPLPTQLQQLHTSHASTTPTQGPASNLNNQTNGNGIQPSLSQFSLQPHPQQQQPAYQRQRPQNIQINPNSANSIFIQQQCHQGMGQMEITSQPQVGSQEQQPQQVQLGAPQLQHIHSQSVPQFQLQNGGMPIQFQQLPVHLQQQMQFSNGTMVNSPGTPQTPQNMEQFQKMQIQLPGSMAAHNQPLGTPNSAGPHPSYLQMPPNGYIQGQLQQQNVSSNALASAAAAAAVSTRQNMFRGPGVPHLRRSVSATTPTTLQFAPSDLHLVSPNSPPVFPMGGASIGLGVAGLNGSNGFQGNGIGDNSPINSNTPSNTGPGMLVPIAGSGSGEDGMPPLMSPTVSPFMSGKFPPEVKRYHGPEDDDRENFQVQNQFFMANVNNQGNVAFVDATPKRRRSNANTVLEIPRRSSSSVAESLTNANGTDGSAGPNNASTASISSSYSTSSASSNGSTVGTTITYPSPANSATSSAGSGNTPTTTPTTGGLIPFNSAGPTTTTILTSGKPHVSAPATSTPTAGMINSGPQFQQQFVSQRRATAIPTTTTSNNGNGNRFIRSPVTANSVNGTGAMTGMFCGPMTGISVNPQNVNPSSMMCKGNDRATSLPSSIISTPTTQKFVFGGQGQQLVFPLNPTSFENEVAGVHTVPGYPVDHHNDKFVSFGFTNFAASAPTGKPVNLSRSLSKLAMNTQGGVEGKFEVLTFHQYEPEEKKKRDSKSKNSKDSAKKETKEKKDTQKDVKKTAKESHPTNEKDSSSSAVVQKSQQGSAVPSPTSFTSTFSASSSSLDGTPPPTSASGTPSSLPSSHNLSFSNGMKRVSVVHEEDEEELIEGPVDNHENKAESTPKVSFSNISNKSSEEFGISPHENGSNVLRNSGVDSGAELGDNSSFSGTAFKSGDSGNKLEEDNKPSNSSSTPVLSNADNSTWFVFQNAEPSSDNSGGYKKSEPSTVSSASGSKNLTSAAEVQKGSGTKQNQNQLPVDDNSTLYSLAGFNEDSTVHSMMSNMTDNTTLMTVNYAPQDLKFMSPELSQGIVSDNGNAGESTNGTGMGSNDFSGLLIAADMNMVHSDISDSSTNPNINFASDANKGTNPNMASQDGMFDYDSTFGFTSFDTFSNDMDLDDENRDGSKHNFGIDFNF